MKPKLFIFYVHVHAYVNTHVCMFVHACVEDRSQPWVWLLVSFTFLFWEKVPHWDLELTNSVRLSSQQAPTTPTWQPQQWNHKHAPPCLEFYVIAGVWTLVPHAYVLRLCQQNTFSQIPQLVHLMQLAFLSGLCFSYKLNGK